MNSADHYIFHCKLIVFMDNDQIYQSYTTVIQNRFVQIRAVLNICLCFAPIG